MPEIGLPEIHALLTEIRDLLRDASRDARDASQTSRDASRDARIDAAARARKYRAKMRKERHAKRHVTHHVMQEGGISSSSSTILPFSQTERVEQERKEGGLAQKFERFWERYPHKVGKKAARIAFEKVARAQVTTFDKLMAGLETYRQKSDDRPWCNPATWLNQGRWDDRPNEVNPNGGSLFAAGERLLASFGSSGVDYEPQLDPLFRLPPK